MKIIWTIEAVEDLDVIYNFYLTHSPTFVESVYDKIVNSAEQLLVFPEMAPKEQLLKDKPQSPRSLIVVRMFKIIYYIEEQTIYIANVWDCRRDPDLLIKTFFDR
ncbi:MAG: type II toxin-antitoxin system RelE/ParE family toxin [Tannerellaceae bacterium]|nr:type II toxin-antitoxin system RelE/ParE family toxin [Tannerellaceae bacterium]